MQKLSFNLIRSFTALLFLALGGFNLAYSQYITVTPKNPPLPTEVVASSNNNFIEFTIQNNSTEVLSNLAVTLTALPAANFSVVQSGCAINPLQGRDSCILTLQLTAPSSPVDPWFTAGNFRACYQSPRACTTTNFSPTWNMQVIPSTIMYTVSPSVNDSMLGRISPDTDQTVISGNTIQFTLMPLNGSTISSITGTCGGNLDRATNIYTTNTISSDCTVIANFTAAPPVSYTVTPDVNDPTLGSISPNTPQSIIGGTTTAFTITPINNSSISMAGTCGGTLDTNTNIYTTNVINSACTVIANFTAVQPTYTVSPSVNNPTLGTISPDTAQTVTGGNKIQFTLTPSNNANISGVTGTCGGTLTGTIFTTNSITTNCNVIANFISATTPPTLTSVAALADGKANGPTLGGTGVILTGTNLPVGQTVVLKFGGVEATSVSVDKATTITANTPAGTVGTTVDINLYAADGTTLLASLPSAYTYRAALCTPGTNGVTECVAQIQACIYVGTADPTNKRTINVTGAKITNSNNVNAPQCVDSFPKFDAISIPAGGTGAFCSMKTGDTSATGYTFVADRQSSTECRAQPNATLTYPNLSMLNVVYTNPAKPGAQDNALLMMLTDSNYLSLYSAQFQTGDARTSPKQLPAGYSPRASSPENSPSPNAGVICINNPISNPISTLPSECSTLNYGSGNTPWLFMDFKNNGAVTVLNTSSTIL